VDPAKKLSYMKSIEKYVATYKKVLRNCDPLSML
jgi:hypothetical protein